MARGITQTDVDQAADALLRAGERPTIERVRQALGTGSPNTVTRLLDVWWRGLGERLQAQADKLALPEAPTEVAALASQLWEHALAAGQAQAEQVLTRAREALAAEQARVNEQGEQWRQQAEAAARAAAEAEAAQHRAEARLDDLHQLVDQQRAQLADLKEQRDTAAQRSADREGELVALRRRLAEAEQTMRQEREAQAEHLRAVESRAYGEVDRLRQELKTVQAELRSQREQHRSRESKLQAEIARLQHEVATTAHARAIEQGRREALERQSRDLQDALRSALAPKPPSSNVPPRRSSAPTPARPQRRGAVKVSHRGARGRGTVFSRATSPRQRVGGPMRPKKDDAVAGTAEARNEGRDGTAYRQVLEALQQLRPNDKSVALTMRVTPIRELGNQTLEQAVLAGEAEKALRYLQSISGGQNG